MASFWESTRVDGAGYAAVAPDLYHRDGPDRAEADNDSWPKTLAFFAKHLARTAAAAR
jgi:hypothetical protein